LEPKRGLSFPEGERESHSQLVFARWVSQAEIRVAREREVRGGMPRKGTPPHGVAGYTAQANAQDELFHLQMIEGVMPKS